MNGPVRQKYSGNGEHREVVTGRKEQPSKIERQKASRMTECDYLYGWIFFNLIFFLKPVTYAKISPKMVNPRDLAVYAEEEEEEEEAEERHEVNLFHQPRSTTCNTFFRVHPPPPSNSPYPSFPQHISVSFPPTPPLPHDQPNRQYLT